MVALDASAVRLNGCTLAPGAEWAAYADFAAEIELSTTALPAGKVEAWGAAQIPSATTEPWSFQTWTEKLSERTFDLDTRERVAARLAGRCPRTGLSDEDSARLQALLPAWGELGTTTPSTLIRCAMTTTLGHAVVALASVPGGCIVVLSDRSVIRLAEDGSVVWKTRAPKSIASLVVGAGWVIAATVENATRTLAAYDLEKGTHAGSLSYTGALAAMSFGPPLRLVLWEDTGHPTDRSTLVQTWNPGDPPAASEVVDHAGVLPNVALDWVQGRVTWPTGGAVRSGSDHWIVDGDGHYKATALTGFGATVLAGSDRLRAFRAGTQLALVDLHQVTALAGGNCVWAGTATGEIARLEITPTER